MRKDLLSGNNSVFKDKKLEAVGSKGITDEYSMPFHMHLRSSSAAYPYAASKPRQRKRLMIS